MVDWVIKVTVGSDSSKGRPHPNFGMTRINAHTDRYQHTQTVVALPY